MAAGGAVPDDVSSAIRRLSSRDPLERDKAACELEAMKERAAPAVPFLIELLADEARSTDDDSDWFAPGVSAQDALESVGEAAVGPLIAALGHEKPPVRIRAANTLGGMKAQRAGRALGKALADPNHTVRAAAALALEEVGRPSVTRLLGVLGDKKAEGRIRALVAQRLGEHACPEVKRALIHSLLDEHPWVRALAAGALRGIVDVTAVAPLLDALRVPQPDGGDHRRYVVDLLEKIGRPAVVPLIKALQGGGDDKFLEGVVSVLAKSSDPRVVAAVIPLLRQKGETRTRLQDVAAWAVLATADADAIPLLVEELKRGEWFATGKLVNVLVKFGEPAVAPLVEALDDDDCDLRAAAAVALGRIGDRRAVEALSRRVGDAAEEVRRQAIRALASLKDPRAVPFLIDAFDARDWKMSHEATKALVEIGEPAVPALVDGLAHPGRFVMIHSATALAKIKDPRAVEPLLSCLFDADSAIARAAANALGEIGDARAVEPVIALLHYPAGHAQDAAASALGKIGDRRAVVPLMEALSLPVARAAAAGALGELADPRSAEALMRVLDDGNSTVRRSAARALGRIRDPRAVEELCLMLADVEHGPREAAAVALGEIGDARAVGPLIEALAAKSLSIRWSAARSLGEIGDRRAVAPLVPLLEEQSGSTRKATSEALARIGGAEAAKALVDALQRHQGNMQAPMADALVEIGVDAIEPCIDALGHRDCWVRSAAANALGKIGATAAVPSLTAALEHADGKDGWRVRQSAHDALRRITGRDLREDEWRTWWVEGAEAELYRPAGTEAPQHGSGRDSPTPESEDSGW
jgi:HEAT repeat protein